MSVSKGKLRPEDEYKLRVNFPFLISEIDTSYICPHAYALGLIDNDDKSEIEGTHGGRKAKTNRFFDMVFNSGKEGFGKLLKCLEPDYPHVIEILRNTPEMPKSPDPYEWFNQVHEQIKGLTITDKRAQHFSFCLGNGWEHLMTQLGFSQPEIEMEKQNETNPTVRISHLLIKWRQKKSKQATVKALVDNLIQLNGNMTIEWEKLRDYVESNKINS